MATKMDVGSEMKKTEERRVRFSYLGPPIVLVTFVHTLTGIVLTDLIVYRTCLISLNINETGCNLLRTDPSSQIAKDLEIKVEPHTSMILMTKSLLDSVVPAILSIFFGSWSDRGGRRPLFLATFTGYTSMSILLASMCTWDISPWYLLLPSIPVCLAGGMPTVLLAATCHISDTATTNNRMTLMAWLEAATLCGEFLCGIAGPYIYGYTGYASVFHLSAVCCISSLACIYFRIPESVKDTSEKSLRGLFTMSILGELFAGVTVKREGFYRPIAWLAILCIAFNAMVDRAHLAIEFLFTRARLSWDVKRYFTFNTASVGLRVISLSGVMLRRHVPDTFLAGVGYLSALTAAIIKSTAWESWHMYLAASIGIFSGITPAVMRSIILKVVPDEDAGKVFSVATVLEVLNPLGGAPLYTLIYSNFLPPIYPSPVYFVSVGVFISLEIFVFCIHFMIKRIGEKPLYISARQEDYDATMALQSSDVK